MTAFAFSETAVAAIAAGVGRTRLEQIGMATLTEKYKPYSAYKLSGVEWLGEIPGH